MGKQPQRASRRWRGAVVVATLVAVVAVAACSDTKKDETSTATATTKANAGAEPKTRTTRGVTATSIKVGGMIYAPFFGGADVGAKARFDRANKDGGVNGRTIEFVGVQDTNNEQANSLSIAQKYVQQDKVFALVPVASSQVGIVDLATREKVPFFGYGVDPAFCGNEYGFGFTGCVTDPSFKTGSNASGMVMKAFFKGDTNKSVAVIGEDFDAGRGGIKLLAGSLHDVGFDVVYAKNPVPAPPTPVGDFSPFVNDVMKAANGQPPDFVYAVLTGATAIGFFGAMKGAGYKGQIVIPSYDPRIAAIAEGAASIIQVTPYEAADHIPRLQEMIDDVKAEKPDQLLTVGVAAGYWAADMFLSLLEKTGKDVTVEKFLAAADGFTYEVPKVLGKSTWPKNHDVPVPCAALALVKGGKFEAAVELTCGTNIDIAG